MPRDLLDPAALLGAWTFMRVIDDHLGGDEKSVSGDTLLAWADGGRIRWSESGTLSFGRQRLPVVRTNYLEPRGDGWFVTFEDGRDFHPWSPGTSVVHHCGADLYSGRIHAGDEAATAGESVDSFIVRWRVTGPKKDYTMTTQLQRPNTSPHP